MPGPPPCRYCNLIFHIVGRGLDPPPHIAFIAPYSRQVAHVGAAYMPPAPPSHRNPLYLSPPTTPIYTLPKNRLSKFVKKSEKTVDKSHTPCYNNQAVSRAQPAAAAAEALYLTACIPFFEEELLQKTFRKPLDKRANLIYNIQAVTETRQHSRTLKIEQN